MTRNVLAWFALAFLLTACGQPPSSEPAPDIPAWAKVAPEQIAEAKKHGVPVAFENALGMRFVLIPAGTFLMGSPEDEEGRFDDETQHEVTISKPFYMQITEVTNEEYRRFRPDHESGEYEGQSLDGERQPVVQVSWEDAQALASWLSQQAPPRRYRLPTEAEWEYACRAGTTTLYSWGTGAGVGWKYGNASDPVTREAFGWRGAAWSEDDGYRVTALVGSYRPNTWGLYDVHGNVFEFCSSVSTECGPWTDGYSGPCHVVKGGSWREPPEGTRCAYRDSERDDRGLDSHGFRLVSPLPEEGEDK